MAARVLPLPARMNPHMSPGGTPEHRTLVERRRLGTTDLVPDAAKPDVTERFDYGHLRVPLPKDLKHSGVFSRTTRGVKQPESYFLMQRSSDGYISGTGLFRAAFPWATQDEETSEIQYIRSRPRNKTADVAGNIWVAPDIAWELSIDYGVEPWLFALLDPADIAPNPNSKRSISHPPKFNMPPKRDTTGTPGTQSTRKRSVRSASPTKLEAKLALPATTSPSKSPSKSPLNKLAQPSPERPKKSPRKPSAKKAASEKTDIKKGAKAASAALQNAFEIPTPDSTKATSPLAATTTNDADAEPLPENTVRVNVTTAIDEDGDEETKRTSVRIEMPAGSPELKLPKTTEGVLKEAENIIDKAKEMQDGESTGVVPAPAPKSHKRKASSMEEEAPEELVEVVESSAPNGASSPRATKRTRLMVPAPEYRRERIQKRALLGLSASLAIGAMIPFVSNLF